VDKYEYKKVELFDNEILETELNKLGLEGWEMISCVHRYPTKRDYGYRSEEYFSNYKLSLIFKKKLN